MFPATLGPRERLLTYAVGYSVGILVPLILGVSFAIGFSQPLLLLFPFPFMLAFGAPILFRPRGYTVKPCEINVVRTVGPKRLPLEELRSVVRPATNPPGASIGLARVEGIHGRFGSYWNRSWGRYQVYVTNQSNAVELLFEDSHRVILSPDDPDAFISAVERTAFECGLDVDVPTCPMDGADTD